MSASTGLRTRAAQGCFALPVLAIALSAAGCHRATEAECEKILDRIVELELRDRGVTDPELIKQRSAETKARKRDALIKSCVGKRISQSNLDCIEKAASAPEITEKCLR
jgi:hypothetical protein